MNWESDNILDYDGPQSQPSLVVKFVGALFLFFVLSSIYRTYQYYDQGLSNRMVIAQLPYVIGNFLAGVGLLTGRKLGWYLAVWLLIQRLGSGIYSYVLIAKTLFDSEAAWFKPNNGTLYVLLFSILFSIFLFIMLYLRSTTKFFGIDRYRQALVPLGAIIFFAILTLILR
ncbi:MAG: hypothetical protein AAFV80_12960 [Bacteroidota bacterium]